MSEDEFLAKVLSLFPDALISEDENGEVVVCTGLSVWDGLFVSMRGGRK